MAIGDHLTWWECPPVIRKQVRNAVLATIILGLAAPALVMLRDPLGIPYEPWGRYGPIAFGLMPIVLVWPLLVLSRRRMRRQFHEALGRLCTHCAYNLTALSERGTCPECGKPFDAQADKAMWDAAGYTIAQ